MILLQDLSRTIQDVIMENVDGHRVWHSKVNGKYQTLESLIRACIEAEISTNQAVRAEVVKTSPFTKKVADMRALQRLYFALRTETRLRKAKDAEARVDAYLERIGYDINTYLPEKP